MEIWTKQVGHPVIDVVENESEGTITLTQHRFFQDGTLSAKDDRTIYPISLGLRGATFVDSELKMYVRSKTYDAPLDFYKLNTGHTGFYRVAYPPNRLRSLGHSAYSGLLSAEDRIGLISDAMAIASSGHGGETKTSAVLELLEGFDDELNYFVWKQVLASLANMRHAWVFEEEYSQIQAFQTCLIKKIVLEKGWDFSQSSEDVLEPLFKTLLFTNGASIPEVQEAAKKMFEKFVAGDEKAINVNIRNSVFAIVLKNGGAKEASLPSCPAAQY